MELARAPLPQHWRPREAKAKRAPPSFEHALTGEVRSGHPMVGALRPWIKAYRQRAVNPRPQDAWAVFADSAGRIFLHDFSSGDRSEQFLPDALRPSLLACVLPPTVREPSAARLAEAADACWPGLQGDALHEAARSQLWEDSRMAARAAALANQPCPLESVLAMAMYLNIEPTTHPQLLWLAHAALTPELPAGWASATTDDGDTFYWHPACGLAQWEHPHVSFLSGVTVRLLREGC